MSREAQKESFKKWYEKNKEKLAEQRKKRYKADKVYRERRKLYSKQYHWLNKRRATPLRDSDIDFSKFKPDEIADVIISDENDIRCGFTVPVPMYYPGTLANVIGRSVQTLRVWTASGYIPESTYRNHANYRLYTKDQLKVYAKNAPLLRISAKDFAAHPYFAVVTRELGELEPDGIVKMTLDRWQFSDSKCPWCPNPIGLDYLRDDGTWGKTPCFECTDPLEIEKRMQSHEKNVFGECKHCGNVVDKDMEIYGNKLVLICPQCNRKIIDPVITPLVKE